MSGKNDKIFIEKIQYFENKFVSKDALCPQLKRHENNDYTTFLSYPLPIDLDLVRL